MTEVQLFFFTEEWHSLMILKETDTPVKVESSKHCPSDLFYYTWLQVVDFPENFQSIDLKSYNSEEVTNESLK